MNNYNDIRWKWLEERGYKVFGDKHQYAYMQSLWSPIDIVQVVCVNANAGTGKTVLATLAGVYEVEKGTYDKIIYIRNAVPIREQGFLPGSLQEKELPYMMPFIEALDKSQAGLYERWTDSNDGNSKVQVMTSAFTRGITFENAFVIIDETQNFELEELQAVLTRIADSCKVVMIGSTNQIDNKKLKKYGGLTPFEVYIEHLKGYRMTIHKLEKNYRGQLSELCDRVKDTVDLLTNQKKGN